MDYQSFKYNPIVETIVNILTTKTQNANPNFFRLQANYFATLVPSMLNVKVHSPITGTIPINLYGISLSPSGSGKGLSTNILENKVLKEFRDHFMYDLFPKYSAMSLDLEAINRANSMGISQMDAKDKLEKEFKSYGSFKFSFDSATAPAIKQLRYKLLLGKIGAINLVIDEIGSNFQSSTDALITFLELYDKGVVKDKLVKSTQENTRHQEITGETPANMMLFGTPSKLLNGGKIEEDFFEFLETGYARRCFFSHATKLSTITDKTPEELYKALANQSHDQDMADISQRFLALCQSNLVGSIINVPESVGIKLLEYRIDCERRSTELPEHQEILKAELNHRYFKALKLAGAYAFIDGDLEVKHSHLEQAIKFAEDSGIALQQMMNREKPYERLAKYIGDCNGKELTQVDLSENLPFYKGSQSAKNEMLAMATAWGYTNNILIKKSFRDGVEFFTGESLKETNLSEIIISASESISDGYENYLAEWNDESLDNLFKQPNYNWLNHHSSNGHRSNKDMKQGFNMIVLDIDGGTPLHQVQYLLKDYEYIIYTTKRHQSTDEQGNTFDRFRLILPMNYELKLNEQEFKQFMQNVTQWCPFDGLDEQTFQRSRKWATYEHTTVYRNQGELFDVLPFIPRTSREAEYKKSQLTLNNLTNLERWFANQMQEGQRNNTLIKYGLMLLDNGLTPIDIYEILIQFNNKLPNPLTEDEINSTVMQSINSRYQQGAYNA